jgi:hypothetical protein
VASPGESPHERRGEEQIADVVQADEKNLHTDEPRPGAPPHAKPGSRG